MYDKERHYPLPEVQWNPSIAEQAMIEMVEDIVQQSVVHGKWPCHPMDDWGVYPDFYAGRGGSLWMVDYLQRVGAVDTKLDVHEFVDDLLAETRKDYSDNPHSENSSYLFGELPFLLMQYQAMLGSGDIEAMSVKAGEIATSIQINDTQPVRELMWGMAGSMLAALFMHRWVGEQDAQWAALYRTQAELMLADWQEVEGIGYLWNIDLYRGKHKFLGAVHGFAGNALALIEGMNLLPDDQAQETASRIMASTVNTAVADDTCANWVDVFDENEPTKAPTMVQYCHGAPGVVISLANLPVGVNPNFDSVMLRGGELIWQAGPLKKGSNLCHGTGGNGYAFLKLFERTGDELWLDRARQFAMHSIDQYRLSKELFQMPRYPLWTGDPGLAVYLWDCLQAQAKFPTIDVF
ncbi:MAG: LanC-like protein [Chloroflexota bacterium]